MARKPLPHDLPQPWRDSERLMYDGHKFSGPFYAEAPLQRKLQIAYQKVRKTLPVRQLRKLLSGYVTFDKIEQSVTTHDSVSGHRYSYEFAIVFSSKENGQLIVLFSDLDDEGQLVRRITFYVRGYIGDGGINRAAEELWNFFAEYALANP